MKGIGKREVTKTVPADESGVPTKFWVYDNGYVTKQPEGTVICLTGGEPCLDKWIKDNTAVDDYDVRPETIGDTNYLFYVYQSGKVVEQDQGVGQICAKTDNPNGHPCLDAWLIRKQKEWDAWMLANQAHVEKFTVQDNNGNQFDYVFYMYKNGSTKFVYLDDFICTTGGYICLS